MLLSPKNNNNAVDYVYKEYQVCNFIIIHYYYIHMQSQASTPVTEAKHEMPSPRIGAYLGEKRQFFI